jgi:hypothetical protein
MVSGKNVIWRPERHVCHNSSDFVGEVVIFLQVIPIYHPASIALEALGEAPGELNGHCVQTSLRGYNA